jgi:hypothetical protein
MQMIYSCNALTNSEIHRCKEEFTKEEFETRKLIKNRKVKLERAHGGCLGTRSLRRTALTPICSGEL